MVVGQVPSELHIVGLFAQTGAFGSPDVFEWQSASLIAIENINANSTILPDTELVLIPADTNTDETVSLFPFILEL